MYHIEHFTRVRSRNAESYTSTGKTCGRKADRNASDAFLQHESIETTLFKETFSN